MVGERMKPKELFEIGKEFYFYYYIFECKTGVPKFLLGWLEFLGKIN